MKIGAQVVAYNQEFLIEYSIRSIYPFVDVIHITASQQPWNYISQAKLYDKPDKTFEILDNFHDPEKKLIIEKGYWSTEEDQRNHSVKILRSQGCDFVFIVDPDEVYSDQYLSDLEKNLENCDTATVTHKIFWHDFNWCLVPDVIGARTFYRIYPDICFRRGRLVTRERRCKKTDIMCHHFSYAMTPERMREKLDTFMHAPQIKQSWYNTWLNWKPTDRNLHPVDPKVWTHAESYPLEDLPVVLKTHPWYGKIMRQT